MLSDAAQSLAKQAGSIFNSVGTDLFDILRPPSSENDGYGNEGADGDDQSVYEFPIPGAIQAVSGSARFVAGGEWTNYKVQIPSVVEHPDTKELIEITPKITDKLKKRAREGVNPEQILFIHTIRPQYGVYYEIICGFNESEG